MPIILLLNPILNKPEPLNKRFVFLLVHQLLVLGYPILQLVHLRLVLVLVLVDYLYTLLQNTKLVLPFIDLPPFRFLLVLHLADRKWTIIQLNRYYLTWIQHKTQTTRTLETQVTNRFVTWCLTIVNIQLNWTWKTKRNYALIRNRTVSLEYYLSSLVLMLVLTKEFV